MLNAIEVLLTIGLVTCALLACALFALIMYIVGGPVTSLAVVAAMATTLYVVYS